MGADLDKSLDGGHVLLEFADEAGHVVVGVALLGRDVALEVADQLVHGGQLLHHDAAEFVH
jgi:hypothetical protein